MSRNISKRNKHLLIGTGILASGLALGFTSGWLTRKETVEEKPKRADHILTDVKEMFLEEGSIEGSWIEMQPVPYEKFAYKTDGYYGGISRYENGELVQYEFIADTKSGSLLELYRL